MTSLSDWRTSGDLINNSGCFKTNIGRIYNSNRITQPRTHQEYYNEVGSPDIGADIIDSYLDLSYSLDRYETARTKFDDDKSSLVRKHRKSDTPTDSSPKRTGQVKRLKKSDAEGRKNNLELQKSKLSPRKPLAIQEFTKRRLSENKSSHGSSPRKSKDSDIPCIIPTESPKSRIKRGDSKKSGKNSPSKNSQDHPFRELVDIKRNSGMNHITLLNGKKISPPINVQCSSQPGLIAPNKKLPGVESPKKVKPKHDGKHEHSPEVDSAAKKDKSKHDGQDVNQTVLEPTRKDKSKREGRKRVPSDTRRARRNSSSSSLNRKARRNSSSLSLEGRKVSSSRSVSRTTSGRRIDGSSRNNSKSSKQSRSKHSSKPSTIRTERIPSTPSLPTQETTPSTPRIPAEARIPSAPRTPTQTRRTTTSNHPPRAHAPTHHRRHQSIHHSAPASSQRLQDITNTSAHPRNEVIFSLPLDPPSYNELEQVNNTHIETPPYRERLHKDLDLISFDPRYSKPVLRINKKLIRTHSKLEKSMWKLKEYNMLPLEINLWDVRQVDDRHLYNIIPELLGIDTTPEQQEIEHALYLSLHDTANEPNESVQCSSSTHSNPHRFRVGA